MRRAMVARPSNNNTKRRRPQLTVGEKDLATLRVPVCDTPPQYVPNPPITRTVRLKTAYNGTAISTTTSYANIAAQDASDYTGQTTVLRYSQMRILKVSAWLALTNQGATPVGLDIVDSATGTNFTDEALPGVDYAAISYRPSLYSRSTYFSTSSTSGAVGVNVGASTGAAGYIILDVTVAFV